MIIAYSVLFVNQFFCILNDFAQLGMPFDHVEDESIRLPKELWLAGLMIVYTIFAQIMKRIYIKINHEWV